MLDLPIIKTEVYSDLNGGGTASFGFDLPVKHL